jgi:hypothetical protein
VKELVFPSPPKTLKELYVQTITLPLVFYGYETWSLTLREEQRWNVLENSVLRRIFGPEGGSGGRLEKTA